MPSVNSQRSSSVMVMMASNGSERTSAAICAIASWQRAWRVTNLLGRGKPLSHFGPHGLQQLLIGVHLAVRPQEPRTLLVVLAHLLPELYRHVLLSAVGNAQSQDNLRHVTPPSRIQYERCKAYNPPG